MTAWNSPLVGSASLDIDHILYGNGSYWEKRGHIFNFSGAYGPPDNTRSRIPRELIEIYRLVGSNRETEAGPPQKKSMVLLAR
jgi:hypothetical protein